MLLDRHHSPVAISIRVFTPQFRTKVKEFFRKGQIVSMPATVTGKGMPLEMECRTIKSQLLEYRKNCLKIRSLFFFKAAKHWNHCLHLQVGEIG